MASNTLLIHSSARHSGSVTRMLADEVAQTLGAPITVRDVSAGLPVVTEDWITARDSGEHAPILGTSAALIDELRAHDTLVIAVPVYNFSIPAALKTWIDQVARAGQTFRYTQNGPEGLLTGKKAYVVVASGGTPVDGPWDYATPYMRHVLGFIGITDVTVIAADALGNDADKKLDAARAQIAALPSSQAA